MARAPLARGMRRSRVPSAAHSMTSAATSSAVLKGWERASSLTLSRSSRMKPVVTGPGETTETLTFVPRSSSARPWEKARRPNLVLE